MIPLVGITSWNRRDLLWRTLEELTHSAEPGSYCLGIVDNGSTDGSSDMIEGYDYPLFPAPSWLRFWLEKRNLGCPQALNLMVKELGPGQPFVKLDNDVLIKTPGWVERMAAFEASHPDAAMIGAYYDGVLAGGRRLKAETPEAFVVDLLPGHFVWHTSAFMRRVGFFDVLHPSHRYGFEDWMMCHKATKLGMRVYVLKDVEMENIQEHKSYAPIEGADKDSHVEMMRPYFVKRLENLRAGRSPLWTGPSGVPEVRPE